MDAPFLGMTANDRVEDFRLGSILFRNPSCQTGAVAIILITIVAIGQGLVDATKTDLIVGIVIALFAVLGGGFALGRRCRQIQRVLEHGERYSARVIAFSKSYRDYSRRVTFQYDRGGRTVETVIETGCPEGCQAGDEVTVACSKGEPEFVVIVDEYTRPAD